MVIVAFCRFVFEGGMNTMRFRFGARLPAMVVVAGLAVLVAVGVAAASASHRHRVFHGHRSALTAAEIRRLKKGAARHSIIIFKNQLTNLPARGRSARARASAASATQAGVRAELARVGAKHVHSYAIINAVSATITGGEARLLQRNPAVRAVVPDAFRHFASLGSGPGPALPAMAGAAGANAAPSVAQPICPSNPAQPMIEPESREVMNVAAANQIADGSGVKVGIIADGIDPNNPDLIRANGQHVIFDYEDFSGFGPDAPTDGREAFLDAGTIASQGNQTYDLSGFVNPAHPLPPGCNIKIEGIAPGASLAVLNVAGSNAGFFNSQIIQAVQWAVMHDHVNILNESIGANPLPNTEDDPVALADQAAIAAGVTVVASSGDAGPFNNIGSPATTPGVIAAGGTQTYRVYRQTTRYGTQLVPGGWEDNNITALSSAGTTEFNPNTVTVVAPGDRGWTLCSSNTKEFFGCADIDHGANPPPIWAAGGTSASAPETSATAADVMEAYANSHGGAMPSPALVKQIIVSTAQDLGAPADHQGAGLVNTLKAVQLAESVNNPSGGTGHTLLVNQTALAATVAAGQSHTFNVNVTNEGSAPQTLTPAVSGLPTSRSDDTGSVTLDASSPTYIDGEGNTDSFQIHTFRVPAGADYLNGDITWDAASAGTSVFETLFDPEGRVAAYSLIGADESGFGHVEVRQPGPGTWTAVIFTVHNAAQYTGTVKFSYATENFHSTGVISPSSQNLASGQTKTFHVTVTPSQAGDESLALHLGTGASDDGSIPITVRALVPIGSHGGSFAGNLTGGGSTGNAGQSFTYQFKVPNGQPSLNVAFRLANPNYQLTGYLVDPNGQALDEQSNAKLDASDNVVGFGRNMQFFTANPSSGLWTVTLLVSGPVDGTHLSEPFTGKISFAAPRVTSNGIPDSPGTVLQAGKPVTARITVSNTGTIRKDYFADARRNGRVQQVLLGDDINDVGLPLSLSAQPNWLVPPGTNALTVLASATVPITMEAGFFSGDPDVGGVSFGNNAASQLTAPELAPGFYFGVPEATGPFPAGGVGPGASVDLAAVANTNPFDPAVSASTGDLWAASVDPTAQYSPLSIPAGGTGKITLTITPTARKGTVVRGFIAVDTFNPASLSGDQVTFLPYTYRVG
jgi:Subtilase family